MYKKWILPSAIAASMLLIGVNTYFLYNKNEIFHKTVISESIVPINKEDFQLFLQTKGLVAPSDIKKVFINTQSETIEQVLVKKGQLIQTGTPLVQLRNEDIDYQISSLENKLSKLQTQAQEIEQSIRDLEEYRQSLEQDEEDKSAQETNLLSEIRQLQTEQRAIEMKINDVASEKDYLEKQKQNNVIKSNTNGVVEKVQLEGDHPFISIVTPPYIIEGELSEFNLHKVTEGQKVKVNSLADRKTTYTGKITAISKIPTNQPTLREKESFYPFYVELEEKAEDLPYGSHVQLAIIVKESEDALSIPKTAVTQEGKNQFVYAIKNGKIKKQKVKLGIMNGSKQEIVSGLKSGDWIIAKPSSFIKEGMLVASPLQVQKVQKNKIKQLSRTELSYLVLKGFLKQ
jgi:HlyD family secretion protein